MPIELPNIPHDAVLLKVREVASELRVTQEKIHLLIASGKLEARYAPLRASGRATPLITLRDARAAMAKDRP